MKRWDGSSQVDLTTAKRWDGSAFVDLTVAKRWDGTAFVDIALPGAAGMSLTLTPTSPGSRVFTPEPAPLATTLSTSASVSVTGGTGPYTYAWSYVSGDVGITASTGTTGTSCGWQCTLHKNSEATARWQVVVTDSTSATRTQLFDIDFAYATNL